MKRKCIAMVLSLVIVFSFGLSAYAENIYIFSHVPYQHQSSFNYACTKAIQVMLLDYSSTTRSIILNSGGCDGSYGPSTASAVSSFQYYQGLTADGSFGPRSWQEFAYLLKTRVVTGGKYYYYLNTDLGRNNSYVSATKGIVARDPQSWWYYINDNNTGIFASYVAY